MQRLIIPGSNNCNDAYFEIRSQSFTKRWCSSLPNNTETVTQSNELSIILHSSRDDAEFRIKFEMRRVNSRRLGTWVKVGCAVTGALLLISAGFLMFRYCYLKKDDPTVIRHGETVVYQQETVPVSYTAPPSDVKGLPPYNGYDPPPSYGMINK